MKRNIIIIISILVLLLSTGLVYFFVFRDKDDSVSGDPSFYGYNPKYADAVQKKKPELCKDINYALQSGPTDAINKVTGDRAVTTCEYQAQEGFIGCECDSEATLNKMRVKN